MIALATRIFGGWAPLVLGLAAVAIVAGLIGAPYRLGHRAGRDAAAADWQARYTALDYQWRAHVATITTELATAREAERDRLERVAADARAMGETAAAALYDARRRAEDLMRELDDERDADRGADAVCGDVGGVLRFNKAIGAPAASAGDR